MAYALPPGFTPADNAAPAAAPAYKLPPGFSPADAPAATPPADPQSTYELALKQVHQNEYPQMSDKQFADYSNVVFPPATIGDQAQNSQLMGWGDELGSAVGAFGNQVRQMTGGGGPGFGAAYDDLQKLEQARLDLGSKNNGALGTAASVVGGLTSFGPGKMAVQAIADPVYQAMLKGAGAGTAIGAVAGAGNADQNGKVLGALVGAGTGGVVGAAVPAVASAASTGWENVANALVRSRAAKAAGFSPEAASVLSTTLGADDSLSAAGAARMQAAGAEGTLADAGPAAKQALDYTIQSSGRAGNFARDQIDARVGRDSAAINTALDHTLGQPQGLGSMAQATRDDTAAARDMAYKAAYAQPIAYASHEGRQIEDLLQRVPSSAITAANMLMKTRGEASSQIMASIGPDGSVVYKTLPDVRQLDYITRGLNHEAKNGIGAGAMGGQTDVGSSLTSLAREIRNATKSAVPEYAIALDTAAEPIARNQALQFGADLLKPSVTRDTVSSAVAGQSGPERQALMEGLRAHIDDTLANVTRTVTDGDVPAREAIKTLRDMSTRAAREKVSLAIGDAEAKPLFDELDRATKTFELRAAVADNSKTYARQAMSGTVNDLTNGGGIVSSLAKGEGVNASKRLIQALTGMTKQRIASRQDDINLEVAKALLARGGHAANNMRALQTMTGNTAGNQAIAKAIMLRGRSLVMPAANVTGRQASGRFSE